MIYHTKGNVHTILVLADLTGLVKGLHDHFPKKVQDDMESRDALADNLIQERDPEYAHESIKSRFALTEAVHDGYS